MKKDTPSYMFFCEFYEILQDSIFIEYIQKDCYCNLSFVMLVIRTNIARKNVPIWSYYGSDFPAFRLNTERHSVSLRIRFECGKILNR